MRESDLPILSKDGYAHDNGKKCKPKRECRSGGDADIYKHPLSLFLGWLSKGAPRLEQQGHHEYYKKNGKPQKR